MSILFHDARKLDVDGEVDEFWMIANGDTITATGSGRHPDVDDGTTRVDVAGRRLVPGFIDLHGHGGGGHSYDGDANEIREGIAAHRAHGTTRTVVSLVTNPLDDLRRSLSTVADLCSEDPTILGSHLEGPFLSEARKGAHNPDHLRPPSAYELEELLGASRGTLRQLTIAPELAGAFEAIDVLVEASVVVAIGHSEADFDLAREAFDRGARILTHAFNAMEGIHHRAPGPVVAAFEDDRVTLELVLDGHHVHPDVARMAFHSAPGRIALVTDAMAAAGTSVDGGEYRVGSLDVTVRDGLAVLAGTTTIAGSTLTQDAALRLAVSRAGIPARDAVAALTSTPAKALGLDHRLGRLRAGFAADAVILDHDLSVAAVWANGSPV
ncbi:N-acetylglucosamine-6-phosphate deacetylase [Cryobacterium mesophilum]|nr:N-acetylglucosamine-6-phosphate deacetylase [Terrimesophilobacter mesophilus]MBB5632832.1 N-acetylglucosamine-6-phosphate deacetylase [Terrimesophilobacter mesophilus]